MPTRKAKYVYSRERLSALSTYQYRAIDKSFISRYILVHYWNWAVGWFPLWMAPNLITLIGLSFMVFAVALVIIFLPDLRGPGPAALYYTFAACLWLYSTFDNVDGKQARRTGTSSPLGELFDHGCDALNCTLGGLVHCAAMGLGTGGWSCVVLFLSLWGFYLPTWEEYHTGILHLGYINGPTEGILIVCPGIWLSPFATVFPNYISPDGWLGRSLVGHVAGAFFLTSFCTFYAPGSLWNVYWACRSRSSSFTAALLHLSQMIVGTVAAGWWLWNPLSTVRRDHFILFTLTIGIVFGKMATKIIQAHVTKRPFPMASGLMFPLLAGSLWSAVSWWLPEQLRLTPQREHVYLWGYFIFALLGYALWCRRVIRAFCDYLGISCLTINNSQKKKTL